MEFVGKWQGYCRNDMKLLGTGGKWQENGMKRYELCRKMQERDVKMVGKVYEKCRGMQETDKKRQGTCRKILGKGGNMVGNDRKLQGIVGKEQEMVGNSRKQ